MTRYALAMLPLLAVATPAAAAPAEFCHIMSSIAHSGVTDGERMASILDGLEAAIVGFEAENDAQVRIVAGIYLSGYSQGVIHVTEPAQFAAEFFTRCMAEGV